MIHTKETDGILFWLANGETGESSKTMAFKLLGIPNGYKAHPYDPSDFKRCLKLVLAVPSIRDRLHEMGDVSTEWNALVANWDRVERMFMEEVPEWLTDEWSNKRAVKTYDLMKSIYEKVK